jgi:hypothetical protein
MGWSLAGFLLMTLAEVIRESEFPELLQLLLAMAAFCAFVIAFSIHLGLVPS